MMIANTVTVLIGLFLAFAAIFSAPPGEMNNPQLAVAAALVFSCAFFARRTDKMRWQSSTSFFLAGVLGLLAASRAYFGESLVSPFWIILLSGIALAIAALWAMLYRAEQEPAGIALL
jgi:hypothetical protein